MAKTKVAILGAGNIATTMARTLKGMEDVTAYAVASRDNKKAEAFALEYGIEKAYGSYEELVCDPEVELVYIATPHSLHYEHAKLCIAHGKPVLCEKAFMANAKQAEEILQYAENEGVFITEAIWTRYMPMLDTMKKILNSGDIGDAKMLTANLGYVIDHVPRLQEPALAGGALLDVGVYTLNFASMLFGTQVDKLTSVCTYTDTGVDEQNSMTITYKDGRMAVLNSSMKALSDRKGIVYGTKGFMIVENINNFDTVKVYNLNYEETASYQKPEQITGFEYEVKSSILALHEGRLECDEMPHNEIIRIMKIMDELRSSWGITYPFE